MHPVIYRRLFLPVYSRLKGDGSLAAYQSLRQHDSIPPEEVRALAEEKLRHLIRHTAAHVPYYRDLFRDRGLSAEDVTGFEDLAQLPVVTKEDIRRAGDRFFARDVERDELFHGSTGGSSGTPFEFWYRPRDRDYLNGNLWRVNSWMGCQPGTRKARVWGCYPIPRNERLINKYVSNSILLPGHNISDDLVRAFADEMQAFHAEVVEGYGQLLHEFCRTLDRLAISAPRSVRAAIYSAEVLGSSQREYIEKVLGCALRQRYGSLEFLGLAGECERARLHITSDVNWLEIIDEAGQPVPAGQVGQIAVTCLHSQAFPLIRYLIGDLGRMDTQQCSCGLPYPVLQEVAGRSGSLLRLPDGSRVTGIAVAHRLRTLRVGQVQVRQISPDAVRVLVRESPGAVREDIEGVLSELSELTKGLMRIEYEYVDEIPRMPSGKYAVIASDWDAED